MERGRRRASADERSWRDGADSWMKSKRQEGASLFRDLTIRIIILYCCLFVVVVVDRFYIALLSALEQTHCARM